MRFSQGFFAGLVLTTPVHASDITQTYVSLGPGYSVGQLSLDVGSADGSIEILSIDSAGAIIEVCGGHQQQLLRTSFTIGAEFCGSFGEVVGVGSYALSVMDQTAELHLTTSTDQRYVLRAIAGLEVTDSWSVQAFASASAVNFKLAAEVHVEGESYSDSANGWGVGTSVGLRSLNQFSHDTSFAMSLEYGVFEAENEFSFEEETFVATATQPTISLIGTFRF